MAKRRSLPTGITKDAHGYRVTVWVRPLDPARKRFPLDTPIAELKAWREEAQARLRRRRRLRKGAGTGALAIDVAAYLAQWRGDVHPVTRAQRERHLGMWVAAFPKRTRYSLTPVEIRTQLITWQREHTYSKATLNKLRQALYQVYAALDAGTGEPNPVAAVKTFEGASAWKQQAPRGVPYALITRVLAEMPQSRARARLSVMAWTGLRPVEVMRIEPGDWTETALVVRTAKGGNATVVPLLPQAFEALKEFAAVDAFGEYATTVVARAWRRALAALGIEADIRPYDLRHSFGTAVYGESGDVKATAELMRHSIAMSERYVAAAVNPRAEAALALLAGSAPGQHPSARPGTIGQITDKRRKALAALRQASDAEKVKKQA